MFLIVGGSKDHNIARLADAVAARGWPHRVIHTDTNPAPDVFWEPGREALIINGETFKPSATSLFIRYDVFGTAADTATALFDAMKGWAEAHPQVGLLNRRNETMEMNKPRALVMARDCGFEIPKTFIASDFNRFANPDDYIVKPVSGGSYTRLLTEVKDQPQAQPFIVQEKLDYPELRLFRVGQHYFAFSIKSDLIDYRIDRDFTMREVAPPADLVAAMEKLTDKLGLDYAAADFKTDSATGRLKFLEVNTMPMFTGYDDAAKGRLSDAIALVVRKLGQAAVHPKAQPPHP